jgi:hypothetical protein
MAVDESNNKMDNEMVVVMKKIKCSTLAARELLNADRFSALSQEV